MANSPILSDLNPTANDSAHSFASTRLYDPSGATVTVSFALPVSAGVIDLATANGIRESIGNLLHAGFSVSAPGLEPGQQFEAVGAVSRREKSDGTPVVDLFADNAALVYKLISVYLDTPEQIAAFETATGLKLNAIPINDGDAAVNRESKSAPRLIVPVKHPAKAILAPNPKYDPNEQDAAKKKPSRLFVAWEGESTPPAAMPATAPKPATESIARPNAGAASPSASTPPTNARNGASGDSFEQKFPSNLGDWHDYEISAIKVVPAGPGKMALLRVHNSSATITMFSGDRLKNAGYDTETVEGWFKRGAARDWTGVTPTAIVTARTVGKGDAEKWEISDLKQSVAVLS